MESIQNELIEIENGFWDAAGGDGIYYVKNFADDGLMLLPFEGGILDKQSSIAAVIQSAKWDEFTIENTRMIFVSKTEYVLVYEAQGKRSGQADYRALISSFYVKRNEIWNLLLHQQTAI